MICPRCKVKMTEQKRSFHKRRKWVCKRCGMAKMQTERGNRKGASSKRRV